MTSGERYVSEIGAPCEITALSICYATRMIRNVEEYVRILHSQAGPACRSMNMTNPAKTGGASVGKVVVIAFVVAALVGGVVGYVAGGGAADGGRQAPPTRGCWGVTVGVPCNETPTIPRRDVPPAP